jgi:riboflavin transporter FmnP
VGELSNFICAAVFGLTASAVYNIKRNDTCLIIALVAAVLVEAGAAMLTNWFIIFPLYIAVGFDFVGAFKTGYVFFAGILPFNLIKFGIQAAAAFAVIKPLSHVPFIKINGSGQSAY